MYDFLERFCDVRWYLPTELGLVYPRGWTLVVTGTEERMAELGQFMEQAKRQARTNVEKRRVALFEKGIWQYMLAGREQYLQEAAAKNE